MNLYLPVRQRLIKPLLHTLTLMLLGTFVLQAQIPKVAFVGITRTSSPDGFSFVVGEDIAGSEVIYFTDEEYRTACGAFHFDNECEVVGDGEPYVTYTTPMDGLTAGEVVFISETANNVLTVTGGGGTATLGGNGGFSISASDKYHAFATSNPADPLDNVTEIYAAISLGDPFDGTVLLGDDPRDDYPNAVVTLLGDVSDAEYNPSLRTNPTTAADLMDIANWNTQNPPANLNLSIVPFTGGIDLAGACVPVINGITVIDCPDTPNGLFTIAVDGALNGATAWGLTATQSATCGSYSPQVTFTASFTNSFFPPTASFVIFSIGDCQESQVCFDFVPSELFGIPEFSLDNTSYCASAGVQQLGGGSPTGGTYSGPGVTDNGDGMTFAFDPAAAGVGTHSITYTPGAGASACENLGTSVSVTVNADPTVTFTSSLSTIGVDAGLQTGVSGGSPTGGVYSGNGVTDDGNGMTFSFDPAAAGEGDNVITYTFTDANGCSGEQGAVITVTAVCDPVITGVELVSCPDSPNGSYTFRVNGSLNGAANWEWTAGTSTGEDCADLFSNISGEELSTAYSPDGFLWTYYVRAVGGCLTEPVCFAYVPADLAGRALFDLGTTSYCEDAGVQSGLGGATPAGGAYSGPGVTDDGNGMTFSFDPAAAGAGVSMITYTVDAGTACGETNATVSVTVNAAPTVTFTTGELSVDVDAGVQNGLSGGMPVGGVYSGNGVTDDGNGMTYSFDPAAAGEGENVITYTFTDANGCTGLQADIITVTAVVLPGDICPDAIDISGLFGGPINTPQISDIQDNTGYNPDNDPGAGYECWFGDAPVLNNTMWFAFTGDGEKYTLRSIQCDSINPMINTDTQFALYSGDCTTPVAVACNDDEDFDNQVYNSLLEITTEVGVNYLLMVDGYVAASDYAAIGTYCLEVTQLETVDVQDIRNTAFNIYPNPTTGRVQLDGFTADRIEVLDQLGRTVRVETQTGNGCDLSGLPAGVYVLRMTSGQEVYSAKVVKE